MAALNFERCLANTLREEGGFSNHPKDPGGATNKGVTQKVYDAWRTTNNMGRRHVLEIADSEVRAIYRQNYWNAVNGDRLPKGVDQIVFDIAVNSGPSRALRFLSEYPGLSPGDLVVKLCERRERFYRSLLTFPTFGAGWLKRNARMKAIALRMVAESGGALPAEPASVFSRIGSFFKRLFGG